MAGSSREWGLTRRSGGIHHVPCHFVLQRRVLPRCPRLGAAVRPPRRAARGGLSGGPDDHGRDRADHGHRQLLVGPGPDRPDAGQRGAADARAGQRRRRHAARDDQAAARRDQGGCPASAAGRRNQLHRAGLRRVHRAERRADAGRAAALAVPGGRHLHRRPGPGLRPARPDRVLGTPAAGRGLALHAYLCRAAGKLRRDHRGRPGGGQRGPGRGQPGPDAGASGRAARSTTTWRHIQRPRAARCCVS
jgi:hypothetical protein